MKKSSDAVLFCFLNIVHKLSCLGRLLHRHSKYTTTMYLYIVVMHIIIVCFTCPFSIRTMNTHHLINNVGVLMVTVIHGHSKCLATRTWMKSSLELSKAYFENLLLKFPLRSMDCYMAKDNNITFLSGYAECIVSAFSKVISRKTP